MLWPVGHIPSGNMANYAALYKAGYEAVKAVSTAIKVIVHFSRGYDNANCRTVLDGLLAHGANFDIIGISVYPTPENYTTTMNNSMANLQDLTTRYDKDVVVVECGYYQNDAITARTLISSLIEQVACIPGNRGLGV